MDRRTRRLLPHLEFGFMDNPNLPDPPGPGSLVRRWTWNTFHLGGSQSWTRSNGVKASVLSARPLGLTLTHTYTCHVRDLPSPSDPER